jgi:malate/lactate dehydrogenase
MASCQSIRQFPTRRPSSKGYCSFAYSAFPLAEFSTELRLPHEESSLTRIASKRRTAGGDIVEAKGETYCGIRTAARDMLAQPTRALVRLAHEFQSELEEARVRAGVNTGYLAEG